MGRLDHQGRIGPVRGTPDGNDVTARQGPGIRRHDGHLHRHFGALTEYFKGVGHQQHRTDPALFLGHTALHARKGMGGHHDPYALLCQILPHRFGHDRLKGFFEPAVIGHGGDLETGTVLQGRVSGVAACGRQNDFLKIEFLSPPGGLGQGRYRVDFSGLVEIHLLSSN